HASSPACSSRPRWAGSGTGSTHSSRAAERARRADARLDRESAPTYRPGPQPSTDPPPTKRSSLMRHTVLTSLAVVLGLGLLVAALADAQAPPTWKQGQPANMADSTLAPIPHAPAAQPA